MLFRKKLSRLQFARFMADEPPRLAAMDACASAHHWAQEVSRHGHEVRLIAPSNRGIKHLRRPAAFSGANFH